LASSNLDAISDVESDDNETAPSTSISTVSSETLTCPQLIAQVLL
jgi:hypothetical protein